MASADTKALIEEAHRCRYEWQHREGGGSWTGSVIGRLITVFEASEARSKELTERIEALADDLQTDGITEGEIPPDARISASYAYSLAAQRLRLLVTSDTKEDGAAS